MGGHEDSEWDGNGLLLSYHVLPFPSPCGIHGKYGLHAIGKYFGEYVDDLSYKNPFESEQYLPLSGQLLDGQVVRRKDYGKGGQYSIHLGSARRSRNRKPDMPANYRIGHILRAS